MNPQDAVTLIQAIIGTVVLASGAVVTWRKAHDEGTTAAAERVERFMDDQEQRIKAQAEEIRALNLRLDVAAARERLLMDYVEVLRLAVSEGHKPPPPPWPAELRPTISRADA